MRSQVKNVEFLNTLKELSGHTTVSSFAKACGKQTSNMSNYLSGKLTPQAQFLRSCLTYLNEWAVIPKFEIEQIPSNLNLLPMDAGVYVIYDSGVQVLYIGKAASFRAEVRQTLGRNIPVGLRIGPSLKKKNPKIRDLARYLSLYKIESPRLRHNMEIMLLRVFANQTHNSNIGNFK